MKKVLLITHDFPPKQGGVAVHLSSLYSRYDKSKLVLLLDSSLKAQKEKTIDDVWQTEESVTKTYYANFFKKWFYPRWLPLILKVWQIVKKEGIEEIHCSHVLPIGTLCYLFFRWKKVPYRIYFHGKDIMLAKSKKMKRKMLKNILPNAKDLVANSEFTRKQIQEVVPTRQDIILWYPKSEPPVEVHQAAVDSYKSQYALDGKFVLLTVARLVKRKGVDVVLSTLQEIVKEEPNIVYVIAGDGPELANLNNQVQELGLQNNVRFVGYVTGEPLATWYKAADCFIMLSRTEKNDAEGFGMVYIEAAAYGKPSIAGNSGGAPEAVLHNKTGIVVDTEKQETVKEAILFMCNEENYRLQLGEAAKARFNEQFSWHTWENDKNTLFEA